MALVCAFRKASGDIEASDAVTGDCLENGLGCCEIADTQPGVRFADLEFDPIRQFSGVMPSVCFCEVITKEVTRACQEFMHARVIRKCVFREIENSPRNPIALMLQIFFAQFLDGAGVHTPLRILDQVAYELVNSWIVLADYCRG